MWIIYIYIYIYIYISWLDKKKKVTINPIYKKDNKSFQYSATTALNYEKIGKSPEAITKIKPFIDKYIWEGIHQKTMTE